MNAKEDSLLNIQVAGTKENDKNPINIAEENRQQQDHKSVELQVMDGPPRPSPPFSDEKEQEVDGEDMKGEVQEEKEEVEEGDKKAKDGEQVKLEVKEGEEVKEGVLREDEVKEDSEDETDNEEENEQREKESEKEEEEEWEGPPPGWHTIPPPSQPPLPLQDGEQVILQVREEQKEKERKLKDEVEEGRENLHDVHEKQRVKKEKEGEEEEEEEEEEGPPPGWDTLPPPPPPPVPLEERGQMVCGSCHRLLSYPRGSKHVRCSCCQTENYVLEEHQVGQVKCGSCAVLLMYPYGAQSVRCCSCSSVIYIGDYNRRPPLSVQQSRATRPFKIAH